jgi:hypothetical protein
MKVIEAPVGLVVPVIEKAIIVDLDGTLYDSTGRKHYVENKKSRNFDMFHKASSFDPPHDWCLEIVKRFAVDHQIIFCSGREEPYRDITKDWLEKHGLGTINYLLYMRGTKDYRLDTVIKKEIYDRLIKNTYDILFVLDDRKSVVDMWREEGLTVLQCDEGNF